MKDTYDVLVIGGGPCGAVAAKTAAEAGLSVLLIEKRPAVGVPVRCAEGIGKEDLAEFMEPDPKWISADIASARIRSPDGTEVSLVRGGETLFYILDRKVFDRELVWKAAEAGAEIQVHARASSPIVEDGNVAGAVIQQHGIEYTVHAKIVIAADGMESQFAKWAGVDTALPLSEIKSCAQYLVHDIDVDEKTVQIFVSSAEAPGGYIWVFPKGHRSANVGVSILGTNSGDGHRARDSLDAFLRKTYPDGKITELMAGGVSACRPLSCMVSDGLMVAGDAARLADPMTGWGIYQAMVSGKLAGETAAAAIRKGDVSREALMAYDTGFRESAAGQTLSEHAEIAERFWTLDDEVLNRQFSSMQNVSLEEVSVQNLMREILKEKL